MTKLDELHALGQPVWYDNIRRSLLDSGGLRALVDSGVRGLTSNPSIFEKAIAGSVDYDQELQNLARADTSVQAIYEILAMSDIRRAADVLRPVYEGTEGMDGYVSLEVNPTLAYDTRGTVDEARRLFTALNRPNAMIKVPATEEGLSAIQTLIGEGINVNVTLIFALGRYEAVIEAYMRGLEDLSASNGDVSSVASVASFFVSRIDTAVDRELGTIGDQTLRGRVAVANAKLAYARFGELFRGKRWKRLSGKGARVQRPLWASTSTKNPSYSDTLYVDSLVGPDTVNTMPPETLEAFEAHGTVARTVDQDVEAAIRVMERLAELDVDFEGITQTLLEQGVQAFAEAFDGLLTSIAEKRERILEG